MHTVTRKTLLYIAVILVLSLVFASFSSIQYDSVGSYLRPVQGEQKTEQTSALLLELTERLQRIEYQLQQFSGDDNESRSSARTSSTSSPANKGSALVSRTAQEHKLPPISFDSPLKIKERHPQRVTDRCKKETPKPLPTGWKQNVVFAMAYTMNLNKLRPFIKSCAMFVKSGSCILLQASGDRSNQVLIDYVASQSNVFIVYEGTDFVVNDAWESFDNLTVTPKMKQLKPDMRRYPIYKSLLLRFGCLLNKVLTSDSADVFFQSDPFDHVIRGLYFAAEIYPLFKSTHYNAMWINMIKDPYDVESGRKEPILDDITGRDCKVIPKCLKKHSFAPCSISEKRVICSGTTAGTSEAMEAYLDAILTLIAKSVTDIHFHGIDQGFHQVLIYRYPWLLHPYQSTILDPFASFITTKGGCDEDFMDVPHVPSPYKLNVPALIHQYNRCPELVKKVNEYFT